MRECLMPPASPSDSRLASAGYTRIWVYNRPVPCTFESIDLSLVRLYQSQSIDLSLVRLYQSQSIDLSLVGAGLNGPVPWTPGLATDVPPESELRHHGEQVAARRHAAVLVDPGARLRPFFQARSGGPTTRAKFRPEKRPFCQRSMSGVPDCPTHAPVSFSFLSPSLRFRCRLGCLVLAI